MNILIKLIKKLLLLILLIISLFILIYISHKIFFEYEKIYNECFNSESEEFIGNCGYYLSQEDTMALYNQKINELQSNKIRQYFIYMIEETENNKNFLNIQKAKILTDCYANNYGCVSAYIEGFEEGKYGFKIDLYKVNEIYIELLNFPIINNVEDIKTYDILMLNFDRFMEKYPIYKDCNLWNEYYMKLRRVTDNSKYLWHSKKIFETNKEICMEGEK